jgi:ABC-type nitrate/sulfonate/bicarbonate transport system ATPase subunit
LIDHNRGSKLQVDMSSPYLKLERINLVVPVDEHSPLAFEDFELAVMKFEFVTLLSGQPRLLSGILRMIAGDIPCSPGRILLADRLIDSPGLERTLIVQSPCLLPWMTAYESVLLKFKTAFPRASTRECHAATTAALSDVGLGDRLHQRVGALTPQLKTKIALAEVIAMRPRLLLLDNPYTELDAESRLEIQELTGRIARQHQLTTLLITSDLDEAMRLSDRLIVLNPTKLSLNTEEFLLPPRLLDSATRESNRPAYHALREKILNILQAARPLDTSIGLPV